MVVVLKIAANYWGKLSSILINWVKERYISGQALEDIQVRTTIDSLDSNREACISSKRGNRRNNELWGKFLNYMECLLEPINA